jgi:O-antigen/teichoic acid export membrane protein
MLRSLLLTLLLGIVFFLAPTLGITGWIHPSAIYMILFFMGISFLIHRLMEYGFRNKRDKFVEFYLSTVVIRLLLCIVFVGIFLYRGVQHAPVFIANFFALYLFYTIFEIYHLYRNLRRDS